MWTTRLAAWVLAATAATATAGEPAAAPTLAPAEVVERNAAARGGLEAWRRIETMAWTGRVESAGPGARRAPFLLEQRRPDRTRFEVVVDGRKAVRVFDGTDGWKLGAGGAAQGGGQPFTADEARFARESPVIEGPLMAHVARGAAVALAGLQEVDGRRAYALDLRPASGSPCRVWLDAETFLELRYDREAVSAQGRRALISEWFADYRTVDGLRLPFVVETGRSGDAARDRLVIERIALNPPLDDAAFARPMAVASPHRGVTVDTRGAARAAR